MLIHKNGRTALHVSRRVLRKKLERVLDAVRKSQAATVEFPAVGMRDEEIDWWLREIDEAGFDAEWCPPVERRLPEEIDPGRTPYTAFPRIRVRKRPASSDDRDPDVDDE